MRRTKVTANATRVNGWWAVEIPEIDGAFTQTRRLDQVARMAAEVVSMLEGIDAESVEVDVVATPPHDDRELIDRVVLQGSKANAAMASYSAESRRVVSLLLDRGYTVRDVGKLLGISATRVSQLSPAKRGGYSGGRPAATLGKPAKTPSGAVKATDRGSSSVPKERWTRTR